MKRDKKLCENCIKAENRDKQNNNYHWHGGAKEVKWIIPSNF